MRRAATELNAVGMDRQDLVRIGPFRGAPRQECDKETLLRWRRRIMGELQELGGPERAARREVGRPHHLAGIDWRQMLVEQTRDRAQRTWWLPRAGQAARRGRAHRDTVGASRADPPGKHSRHRAALPPSADPSLRRSADDQPRRPHRLTAPVRQGAGRPAVLGAQQEAQYLTQGGRVGVRRLPHCTCRRPRPLPRTRLRPRPRLPVLQHTGTPRPPVQQRHPRGEPLHTPLRHQQRRLAPPLAPLPRLPRTHHPAPAPPRRMDRPHGLSIAAPDPPRFWRAQALRCPACVLDRQSERTPILRAHCRRRLLPLRRAPCPGASPLPRSRRAVSCLVGRDGSCRGCCGRS